MVNTSLSLQGLDPEIHLTAFDRVLLDSVRKDVTANTNTIVERNYTGKIDDEHIDDILQSIVVSIVTKRLVYLNEFMEGLDSYGLKFRYSNISGYAEAVVVPDNDDEGMETSAEPMLFPDCTPAGVMGWLTGQKHKPLDGQPLKITVRLDHDCLATNPNHHICFPVVGSCAKGITLPVAHMKTAEEFNEVFMIAVSKG